MKFKISLSCITFSLSPHFLFQFIFYMFDGSSTRLWQKYQDHKHPEQVKTRETEERYMRAKTVGYQVVAVELYEAEQPTQRD